MDYNHITKIPYTIGKLENLKTFNIESTRVTELPDTICNIKSLKRLNLNNNRITRLPNNIGNLINLTDLSLEYIPITSLPDSICDLFELKELILSGCELETLPNDIGQLSNLIQLDIDDNNLTSLPESIFELDRHCEIFVSVDNFSPLNIERLQQPRNYGPNIEIDMGGNGITQVADPYNWLKYTDIDHDDVCWEQALKVNGLDVFLTKLSETAEYEQAPRCLSYKIVEIMNNLNNNQQLREQVTAIMFEANRSCCDRITFALNQIEVLCKIYNNNKSANETIDLILGIDRIERLRVIAKHKVDKLKQQHIATDEVETYLIYQTRLKDKLNLPTYANLMMSSDIACVTDNDIEKAYNTIINNEDAINILCNSQLWNDYLKNNNIKYKVCMAEIDKLSRKLLEDGDYNKANDIRKKLECDLVKEITELYL
jgi:Leucine-rich repeat (LRR) protein